MGYCECLFPFKSNNAHRSDIFALANYSIHKDIQSCKIQCAKLHFDLFTRSRYNYRGDCTAARLEKSRLDELMKTLHWFNLTEFNWIDLNPVLLLPLRWIALRSRVGTRFISAQVLPLRILFVIAVPAAMRPWVIVRDTPRGVGGSDRPVCRGRCFLFVYQFIFRCAKLTRQNGAHAQYR